MKKQNFDVKKYKQPKNTSLVLKVVNADMTAYGGFKWPEKGIVSAPDWQPTKECGNGLHGWINGEGNGRAVNINSDSNWLICEVATDTIIDLGGKVKFPAANVIYCGDQKGATDIMQALCPGHAIIGGTATAGDGGTATAGYRGTATAGDRGTATAGYMGTATAGYYGTATAGDDGTATAGDDGILIIKWHDGDRYRISTAYVGEDGIKANVAYRLDDDGKFIACE